jgi:hypothetical protein
MHLDSPAAILTSKWNARTPEIRMHSARSTQIQLGIGTNRRMSVGGYILKPTTNSCNCHGRFYARFVRPGLWRRFLQRKSPGIREQDMDPISWKTIKVLAIWESGVLARLLFLRESPEGNVALLEHGIKP